MEWTPDNSNQDIDDRRDSTGGGGYSGSGLGGFGFGHLGIGGILIVGLLSLVFHQNFFSLLSGGGGAGSMQPIRINLSLLPPPIRNWINPNRATALSSARSITTLKRTGPPCCRLKRTPNIAAPRSFFTGT